VSGHIDASANVPAGKEHPNTIQYEAGWAPESIREFYLFLSIGYLQRNSEDPDVCLCMGHDF
jgi:hypothetical protein